MPQNEHYYNIDILKLIFACAVIGFHTVYLHQFDKFGLSFLYDYMKTGNVAVNYFFVISAFFLWKSVDVHTNVIEWVKKRFLRLAPAIAFVTLLYYIVHLCGVWGFNVSANIEQILLIRDWSFAARWGAAVHPAWFVSALLLISLYLIGLKKSITNRNLLLLLLLLSMYIGWRIKISPIESTMSGQNKWWGMVLGNRGTGGALFCMGLGCLLYEFYAIGKQQFNTTRSKILWSITEAALLFFVLQKLFNGKSAPLDELLSTLSFALLFWSFINHKGLAGELLNCRYFQYVSRYSYACFICHAFVLDLCHKVIFPKYAVFAEGSLALLCIIGLVSLFSAGIYHLIEVPMNHYLRRQKA